MALPFLTLVPRVLPPNSKIIVGVSWQLPPINKQTRLHRDSAFMESHRHCVDHDGWLGITLMVYFCRNDGILGYVGCVESLEAVSEKRTVTVCALTLL